MGVLAGRVMSITRLAPDSLEPCGGAVLAGRQAPRRGGSDYTERMSDPDSLRQELSQPFELEDDSVEAYRRDGFVRLEKVLSADALDHYGVAITQQVAARNSLAEVDWSERTTYERAFVQVMNLWRDDPVVRELVFSTRLAQIAAELMGARGVRLYHDQALYKEPSPSAGVGGHTPWHVDQFYWPIEGTNTVTAWIPLQPVPEEMGPLSFAVGSHQFEAGRDLAISDESEEQLSAALVGAGFEADSAPYELGEVSFHAGWTFHRAGANRSDSVRRVMTIIYLDVEARVKHPENDNQQLDLETWLPGVAAGEVAASPINPVLWTRRAKQPGAGSVERQF